jgi:hypothetical protein
MGNTEADVSTCNTVARAGGSTGMQAPMSRDLTAKQRDVALQKWRSLIMRE